MSTQALALLVAGSLVLAGCATAAGALDAQVTAPGVLKPDRRIIR